VDRLLTLWIILACGLGIGLSQIEAVRTGLAAAKVGTVNIPIGIGLILMMFPPLAKVHYDWIPRIFKEWKLMGLSVVQNWIIGPLLMFFLAFAFLHNHPDYMQGVILVGCARCIAMVLVWNEFAFGSSDLCATLFAFNSMLTLVLYTFYAYALIDKLLPAMGVATAAVPVESATFFLQVLESVAIYLGIPFVMGLGCWIVLRKIKGEEWYYNKFVKWISPLTLGALLFTIVLLFAMQGYSVISRPLDILLVAAPMLIYFIVMFVISFFMTYFLEYDYPASATVAFTAASNNFELALAIAISVFGSDSNAAFATIIGPLVEIPVMLILVYVSKLFGRLCYKNGPWRWSKVTAQKRDEPPPALELK